MFSKDIGIDLGTASILVYVKGKGVVLREPSVVAIDKNTGKLLKVGTEAQQMLGRTPGNIVAIRPLREGVISDYDMTERMLKEFIRKVTSFRLFKPRIVICVPSGITKVEEPGVLAEAVTAALAHDSKVVIEEAVPGFEVGCAVLGNEVLTVGHVDEIELSGGFFNYTEKYGLITSSIHMPARISQEKETEIQATAQLIYRALECSGFARVDLFLTPDGRIVFNEVNTIPGFTAHSRYPNMMRSIGLEFGPLLDRLIGLAVDA